MDNRNTDWRALTVVDLKAACKLKYIPTSGLKQDLIARLEEHNRTNRPAPPLTIPAYTSPRGHDVYRSKREESEPRMSREAWNIDDTPTGPRNRQADTARRVSNPLNEAKLEVICRENYVPKDIEGRRATIQAEFSLKVDELKKKRDAAIAKIEGKHKTEFTSLEKESNIKTEALEAELRTYGSRKHAFSHAYTQLKSLRASRGLSSHPNDFAPDASPYLPAPHNAPASKAESSATVKPSPASTLKSKAIGVVPTAPASSEPNERPHEDPASDREISITLPVRPMADRAPRGPGSVIEDTPIRPQLDGKPYVFLSAADADCKFKEIRVDITGFYMIFHSDYMGKSDAEMCYRLVNGINSSGGLCIWSCITTSEIVPRNLGNWEQGVKIIDVEVCWRISW
ncbi:hypothetical protein BDZ45DRAFT_808206 [Acephala macrosclerotiorum]|nr:hypothetical protein BDZ45DRAFT_808206 [Acephala macrosclerotiorum]